MTVNPKAIAGLVLTAGLVVGTIGYIAAQTGHGDLIPPAGWGWLEVVGFVLVIPSAIFLKRRLA